MASADGANRQAWPPSDFTLPRIAGYLIRRSQRVHNTMWLDEFRNELTSPQYAALAGLAHRPHTDQRSLGSLVSLDTSSIADVVARLVDKMWIVRHRDEADGRRNVLALTPAAVIAFEHLTPSAWRVQDRLLQSLDAGEREDFVARLHRVARVGAAPVADPEGRTAVALHLGVPGHLIRRAQQVHTAIWSEVLGRELTSPQYATMHVIAQSPGINQRTLGERAALDKSTAADIVERLMGRGHVIRTRDPDDGRGKLLTLSAAARRETEQLAPRVAEVQARLLAPLTDQERTQFLDQLARIAFGGDVPVGAP